MGVTVRVTFVACRGVEHPHRLVKYEEGRESEEDGSARRAFSLVICISSDMISRRERGMRQLHSPNDDVPLLLHVEHPALRAILLAEEAVRHKVEEDVAEEAARRKRDHGVQG
jgi:hypothetical protein